MPNEPIKSVFDFHGEQMRAIYESINPDTPLTEEEKEAIDEAVGLEPDEETPEEETEE